MAMVWQEIGIIGAKLSQGSFEATHNTTYYAEVECGFKPKYIAIQSRNYSSVIACSIYDESLSTSTVFYAYQNGAENIVDETHSMSGSSNRNGCIVGVTDTGFKVGNMDETSEKTMYYFAVG